MSNVIMIVLTAVYGVLAVLGNFAEELALLTN